MIIARNKEVSTQAFTAAKEGDFGTLKTMVRAPKSVLAMVSRKVPVRFVCLQKILLLMALSGCHSQIPISKSSKTAPSPSFQPAKKEKSVSAALS